MAALVLIIMAAAMAHFGFASGAAIYQQQKKSPCCLPDQYSTTMTNMATVNSMAVNTADIQMDYATKRLVLINYTTPYPPARSGANYANKILIDYGKRMLYVIPGAQPDQCYKYPYNQTLFKCVPEDAQYLEKGDLGPLGVHGLSFEVWRFKYSLVGKGQGALGPSAFVTLAVHQSPDACVPVVEGVDIRSAPNLNQLYMYTNFQNKLKDPSVFNLPPSCNK